MKNATFLLFLIIFPQLAFGQDKINFLNNQHLIVNVIEQTKSLVKFKMADYSNGPTITMKTKHISSIEYKNGYVELFGSINPRTIFPLGISIGAVPGINEEGRTGGLYTTTFDYFINSQFDFEVSIGTDFGLDGMYLATGARFNFNSKYSNKKFTPFTGLTFGTISDKFQIQVPIGLNYISKTGFNTSISLNEMILEDFWQAITLEFRVGWRFKY